jgi:hypothetical protein
VDDLAARRGHRLIRVSDKIERIKKEREEAEEQSAHLRQVNKDLASYLALQLQRCDPTEITELQANLQQMRAEVGRLLKENEDIRFEKFAADECAEEEKQAGLEEKRARLEAEIQLQELTEELELVKKELLLQTKPDAAVLKEQRGRLEAEVLMKEYREEVAILRAEIKVLKEAQ